MCFLWFTSYSKIQFTESKLFPIGSSTLNSLECYVARNTWGEIIHNRVLAQSTIVIGVGEHFAHHQTSQHWGQWLLLSSSLGSFHVTKGIRMSSVILSKFMMFSILVYHIYKTGWQDAIYLHNIHVMDVNLYNLNVVDWICNWQWNNFIEYKLFVRYYLYYSTILKSIVNLRLQIWSFCYFLVL